MIFLESKENGRKIAYAVDEAKADKLNGWVEVTKDEYYEVSKKSDDEGTKKESLETSSQENVAPFGQKRKGRPPNKLNK